MDNEERKLSDFIDRLNAEKKPDEDGTGSEELNELFETVKQIRSLKEPTMPGPDFEKKLTHSVKEKTARKQPAKNRKWAWAMAVAGVAAIVALMMNILLPFGNTNVVSAMEKAYSEVDAYHGILEIVQTNGNGESFTQGAMEVWASKDGHYYVKGLEGSYQNLVTVNNGEKKWQVQPGEKQVHVFPAFPDAYRFIFELGNEVEQVTNSTSTEVIGEGTVAGRKASILEVTPKGGSPYKIWIDKETKLPMQKQTAMHNAIQYTVTYTQIDFDKVIPKDLISYDVPNGYEVIETNPEQIVNDASEVEAAVGFMPESLETVPTGYTQDSLAVVPDKKLTKTQYSTQDKDKRVLVIQRKSGGEIKPAPNAIQGKMNGDTAEIQSPITKEAGVLENDDAYTGLSDVSSIRWVQDGYEFAVVGNATLENLQEFAESLRDGVLEIPSQDEASGTDPQVDVPYDMEVEENDQKSVDAGSSPWRLDPAYTAQVFVSLQMSPGGITGDYPIDIEDLEVTKNTGSDVTIEVNDADSPVKTVYLKRVVRQDTTGIWTVVGYDPR